MRNSTSASTPKTTKTAKDESSSTKSAAAEKTSAKKLKQARLPFKVIAPGTSPVGSKAATTLDVDKVLNKDGVEIKNGHNKEPSTITTTEGRKRKLSYDSEGDNDGTDCNKDNEADDNVSKENVEVLAAASKKKKLASGSDGTSDVIVSLLDDDSNDAAVAETSTVVTVMAAAKDSSLKTPKVVVKEKRKGAGTPQTSSSSSSSAQKDKSGSASKLQIKLPLSAGKKNKRRKSKLLQLAANTSMNEGVSGHNNSCAESSDDIEEVASKLNPLKRKKLDIEAEDQQDAVKDTIVKKQDVETIALDSESEAEEDNNGDKQKVVKESSTATNQTEKKKSSEDNEEVKSKENHQEAKKEARTNNNNTEKIKSKSAEKSPEKQEGSQIKDKLKESKKDNKTNADTEKDANTSAEEVEEIAKISDSSDDEEEKSQDKEDLNESVQSDNDNEADDERENMAAKSVNISSDLNEDPKSKHPNTVESLKDTDNASTSTKNLTPKQIKLLEQRRKAREEKERKLQEEKMKKQHEKEEKEQAKKREREEKEEQKKKEREEKEEQKKKEREEKERKRLAEVEAKNEEKRKKNEAKEEEIRKKEEERKRKEQEKEEAELKKKKAAQAFTKFFVPKAPSQTQVSVDEDSNTGDGSKLLAFRPFQVKGDMKLAPLCRKVFSEEAKCRLDSLIGCRHKKQTDIEDDDDEEDIVRRKPLNKSQLYLSELRSGKILPGKWRRPSTESKDDVIIVEDDLERVGQAIVEDTPAYVREQMRVKLYKFHDNRRPPYYGTWRKKSTVIKPTKPFEQDKKFFDYEVDSDDEWEEEEPGESLEDGSDDDKEKESGDDDDYEVDNKWFVPHGHLSDEEMQNEDECGGMGDNNTREAQKAKLQILQQEFAQEMKKKTEKIKPRLIGCIWVDKNGNQPTDCAKIIWDTLQKKAMLLVEPPLVEEPEVDKSTEPSSPSAANANADKQPKNIVLSENMVKDLTRLIHGNNHSKNFLINEYLAFVEKTEDSIKNGDLRKPLKSVIRDKIDEMAEWQSVDATAASVQEMEQAPNDDATESTKKKKKSKRRLCWVVKQEMLDKMDLSSLELQNSWEYTLPPKFLKADKDIKTDEATTTSNALPNTTTDTISTASIPPAKLEETKTKTNTSQITKFTKVLTAEEKANKLKNPTQPPSTPSSPSTTNSNIIENKASTPTSKTGKEKKRVPLLMSVARGQQISTPAKNKLISQFLQKDSNDNTSKASSSPTSRSSTRTNLASSTSPTVEDDDIVILD